MSVLTLTEIQALARGVSISGLMSQSSALQGSIAWLYYAGRRVRGVEFCAASFWASRQYWPRPRLYVAQAIWSQTFCRRAFSMPLSLTSAFASCLIAGQSRLVPFG